MDTTVILGTGIIGASIAYYLSQTQSPSSIHLVEASPTLFASASGFAGGFIAADWHAPAAAALGRLSFEEHHRLAQEYGGREKWGFARSRGFSYAGARDVYEEIGGEDWLREGVSRAAASSSEGARGRGAEFCSSGDGDGPRWLRKGRGDVVDGIGDGDSTAQVDPLRLSHFLLQSCRERGVLLHHPVTAVSVQTDTHSSLSSIRILNTETKTETEIPCAKIVIAAGAWSPQVFSTLFPTSKTKIPISSIAGHSLVVRSPRWGREFEEGGCHAVFANDEEGWAPELFSRIGGEIYIAGLNDVSLALPRLPTEAKVDDRAVGTLKRTAKRLLSTKGDGEDLDIVRTGLCFRPVTRRGTPILARIPEDDVGTKGVGVWIAAGHGPWGISLSLGTGKVMAEMIQGRPTSADVRRLGL